MRLIDANVFEKFIKEKYKDGESTDDVKDQMLFDLSYQPTAYNVEKVVEGLEEWSFETEIVIPGSDGYDDTANRKIICTDNAIDIVRKGGVE